MLKLATPQTLFYKRRKDQAKKTYDTETVLFPFPTTTHHLSRVSLLTAMHTGFLDSDGTTLGRVPQNMKVRCARPLDEEAEIREPLHISGFIDLLLPFIQLSPHISPPRPST